MTAEPKKKSMAKQRPMLSDVDQAFYGFLVEQHAEKPTQMCPICGRLTANPPCKACEKAGYEARRLFDDQAPL